MLHRLKINVAIAIVCHIKDFGKNLFTYSMVLDDVSNYVLETTCTRLSINIKIPIQFTPLKKT